jgi:phospholipase/carboxylesterase
MEQQQDTSLEYTSIIRESATHSIVLFHGFGADYGDLKPLADELDPRERLDFYFPRAPRAVTVQGQSLGRAWFPQTEEELEQALFGTYFHELADIDPPGLRECGRRGVELIQELGLPWDRLFVGGFSQGAIVAVEVALAAPSAVAGLLMFSASAIARERWERVLRSHERFPFFQAHGTSDPVLPFQGAQTLNLMLENAGYAGEMHPFPGGHEIAPHVLSEASAFLVAHM